MSLSGDKQADHAIQMVKTILQSLSTNNDDS